MSFGTRIQFVFLAVLLPVLAGDVLKGIIGRGRPFVGGEPNAFLYHPFEGSLYGRRRDQMRLEEFCFNHEPPPTRVPPRFATARA